MKQMIIGHEPSTLHVCPTHDHKEEQTGDIPHYYNDKHAFDSGWAVTSDIMYCEPELDFVWICPECVKNINNSNT